MKNAVSCSLMKKLDQNTIRRIGIPSLVLMERAALKTAEEMEKVLKKTEEKILCVCGSGNNGGDGIAIARILFLHGYHTEIYMAGNLSHMTQETKQQYDIARNYQVPVVNNPQWQEYTTIVDAVFGVGLTRPVEGRYADLLHEMNRTSAWKVAVDIPSGVNGDTGAVMGTAFLADLTVTFAFRKAGLCLFPGRKLAGKTVTADIGIYESSDLMEPWYLMDDSDIEKLPPRDPEGNKGTFGKVLAVAGSAGMCGAAYFCASAALASGAGMVKVLTEKENRIPLQTLLPEAIVDCSEKPEGWKKALDWCDVLIIGPGIGKSERSRMLLSWFLEHTSGEKPVILDADGLNLLAENPQWKKFLGKHTILTPHMGEMSRLTGKTIAELQKDRIAAAREMAKTTGAICVLKDACTVTASPDGALWLNLSGNPGMAVAGSGDVLTGVLAGMCCMELGEKLPAPDKAAALGVYIHGRAGDLAAKTKGKYGMKAGDLLPAVSEVTGYGGKYEKI